MAAAIEFFFDFSSPYAYLASRRIGAIADRHGREVWWRPMMLGPALAATGGKPLVHLPLKGDYARRDLARTARFYGIPFAMPTRFPVVTLTAARVFYGLMESDGSKALHFAEAALTALFAEDRDIADRSVIAAILAATGVHPAAGLAAADDPRIKELLKTVTAEAIGRGVFGSPFFFVDGEPFWGSDRLDQLDCWLASGGY